MTGWQHQSYPLHPDQAERNKEDVSKMIELSSLNPVASRDASVGLLGTFILISS